MYRTQDGWIEEFKMRDALWIHSGKWEDPHALLTSGGHSSGYFNSRKLGDDLLSESVSDLMEKLLVNAPTGVFLGVQGVVGPQTGAVRLAQLLSIEITYSTGRPCFSASPAKEEKWGRKEMVFSEEHLELLSGRSILLCEDVITTGGSVRLAAEAVIRAGGEVCPLVLTLVNRSGVQELDGRKIISLIDRSMPIWDPSECPLCQMKSEPVRPKDNWDLLVGRK